MWEAFRDKFTVFLHIALVDKLRVPYAAEIFRLYQGGVLFYIVDDAAFSEDKAYPSGADELVPQAVGNVQRHKEKRADIVSIAAAVEGKVADNIVIPLQLLAGDGYAVDLAGNGAAVAENAAVDVLAVEVGGQRDVLVVAAEAVHILQHNIGGYGGVGIGLACDGGYDFRYDRACPRENEVDIILAVIFHFGLLLLSTRMLLLL